MFEIKFKTRNNIQIYHELLIPDNKTNSQTKFIEQLCNNNFDIRINICKQKGENFFINLSLYDTIQRMKDCIAIRESIPQNLQILKLNDIILENNTKRLIDYKIKNGDIIKLSVLNEESEEISIILTYEKRILINVKFLDNVGEIRNNQNIKNLKDQEQYKLYFKNNELNENKTFFDYRIKQGDKIEFKKIEKNENNQLDEINLFLDNYKTSSEEKIKNLEKINKSLLKKIDQLEKKLKEMAIKNEKEIIKKQELINKNKELNNLLANLENKNLKEMKNKDNLIYKEKEKVKELNKKLEEFVKIKNKKFEQKEIINLLQQINEKEEEIKNFDFEVCAERGK